MTINPMEVGRFAVSPSGRRVASTVLRLVKRDRLPLEQAADDVVAFMEELERLSDATGKPVKQVADEALGLFRREHKC